jgi:hypothetical protein
VFPIDVPPLRDSRDDILLLVHYFANKYARRMEKQIDSVPNETMDALSRYSGRATSGTSEPYGASPLLSTGPRLRALPKAIGLSEALVERQLASA